MEAALVFPYSAASEGAYSTVFYTMMWITANDQVITGKPFVNQPGKPSEALKTMKL